MSRVVVHRRAAKYLKSLPNPLQKRIKLVLSQLSEASLNYPGVIRMAGDWSGFYRIRVGPIRVIFLA
jgi:mRNA interferase RelE/StbE